MARAAQREGMMAAFGRDWWPEGTRAPLARLAAGLVIAPLALAVVVAGVAFLVAGSALPDAASVGRATQAAGLTALAALVAFSFTFGLAGVLLLWRKRSRTALAFAGVGALAGALFAVFSALVFDRPLVGSAPPVLAALGAAHLLVVRWVAGIRTQPTEGEEAATQ